MSGGDFAPTMDLINRIMNSCPPGNPETAPALLKSFAYRLLKYYAPDVPRCLNRSIFFS